MTDTDAKEKSKGSCCAPARTSEPTPAAISEIPLMVPAVAAASGLTVDIVDIPGGRVFVGTDHPILKVDGEAPARQVRINPFCIDETTVTNARFAEFVSQTGYRTEAERFGNSFVFEGLLPQDAQPSRAVVAVPWWREIEGANWRLVYGPGSEAAWHEDHPVVHVTWNDAVAFAAWAGGRLPTEAEWEHAARGGLGDVRFPWGDAEPDDKDFQPCNIWQGEFPHTNRVLDGYFGTAPARSFEPNGYGLYNMVGNVWEWAADPFKVRSLKKSVAAAHAGKKGYKLSKGGSFLCHASYCYRYRIAARTGNSPDSSTSHVGFRLVYDKG